MRWLIPRQGFRSIIGLVVLAACREEPDLFPINPGSGAGGAVGIPDAAAGDGPTTGIVITGRVCVLTDGRMPSACASTGANGLSVQLGDSFATTNTDGTFALTRPTGTDLVWHVTDTRITPAAMLLSGGTTIPAISALVYGDMLAANLATVIEGDGALLLQLTRAGVPELGATVVVTPVPDSLVYFDGATPTEWLLTATGDFGAVWVPSLPPGDASIAVDARGTTQVFSGIPVFANTVTFADLVLQ